MNDSNNINNTSDNNNITDTNDTDLNQSDNINSTDSTDLSSLLKSTGKVYELDIRSLQQTYALRRVIRIVCKCNKKYPKISINIKTNQNVMFCKTGCLIFFNDYNYTLSIQTKPEIAAWAFCETALISTSLNEIVYIEQLGYRDIIRHYDEDDFENHLCSLFENIPLVCT